MGGLLPRIKNRAVSQQGAESLLKCRIALTSSLPKNRWAAYTSQANLNKLTPWKLRASIEGLRVVLIGDIHEQPILHIKIKPFNVGVKDWSGEV